MYMFSVHSTNELWMARPTISTFERKCCSMILLALTAASIYTTFVCNYSLIVKLRIRVQDPSKRLKKEKRNRKTKSKLLSNRAWSQKHLLFQLNHDYSVRWKTTTKSKWITWFCTLIVSSAAADGVEALIIHTIHCRM